MLAVELTGPTIMTLTDSTANGDELIMAKVLKGQKATYSADKKTITTRAYPKKPGYAYKIHEKTWKNYCPLCKRSGTLTFNPKKAPEAELTCGNGHPPHYGGGCDADFCCVSGQDTHAGKSWGKLTPATASTNKKVKVADSKTQKQKCNLSKAEAKKKAKSLINTGKEYKGKLEVPASLDITVDDLLSLNFKGFDDGKRFKDINNKTLSVESASLDIDNQKLSLDLVQGSQVLGEPYDGDYIITTKNGKIVTNRSKKNPFKGKPSSINPKIGGFNEQSAAVKKIMLKGQELGSVSKIYKYLKVKEAGGTAGFKYKYYIGHKVSSEKETEFGAKSAEKCWSKKTYNCVDASWLFYIMCKGAGKTVDIIKAEYTGLDGVKRYHMYNKYKGKTYDVSQNMKQEVDGTKIVNVKTSKKK